MASYIVHSLLCVLIVLVITDQGLSSSCSSYYKGTCLDLSKYYCQIGNKIAHSGCGFREACCYPSVKQTPKFHYGSEQCGVASTSGKSKIVGGRDASILEFPWTVSLQKSGQPVCGGSIVGDRWILTAAHCIVTHSTSITIVAGSTSSYPGYSGYTKRHYVSKIIRHTKFNPNLAGLGYDIALIKLSRPLDVGTTITRKVCLPDSGESFANSVCVATGWGYVYEPKGPAVSSGGSRTLRQGNLPILTKSLCRYYLGSLRPNTICAGYRSGGEDTCQGDSGGPLVCKGKDGYWKQAGIVSVGRGCARRGRMGVYTEVAGFTKWIDYVMKKY